MPTTFDRKLFNAKIDYIRESISELEQMLLKLKQDATVRDAQTLIQATKDRLYALENISYGIEQ